MFKRTLIAIFCFMATAVAFSQNKDNYALEETVKNNHSVETNSFWRNCFISIGAGTQMYVGDHDGLIGFGDRLSAALDISAGKWFDNGIGVRLSYSGLSAKGATRWDEAHSTGENVPGWGIGMSYSKFNLFNLHADAMFNLHTLIKGADENRVWNTAPYVGIGCVHAMDAPKNSSFGFNAGWMNSFRINSRLDANIDLRGLIMGDGIDGEKGGVKLDGMLTLTAGLTYKF